MFPFVSRIRLPKKHTEIPKSIVRPKQNICVVLAQSTVFGVTLKCEKESFSRKGLLFAKRT